MNKKPSSHCEKEESAAQSFKRMIEEIKKTVGPPDSPAATRYVTDCQSEATRIIGNNLGKALNQSIEEIDEKFPHVPKMLSVRCFFECLVRESEELMSHVGTDPNAVKFWSEYGRDHFCEGVMKSMGVTSKDLARAKKKLNEAGIPIRNPVHADWTKE